jgi:hypothetical protein
VSVRVRDALVQPWLTWARNFGEVVAWQTTPGAGRRFRVRVTPGITHDGMPYRPKGGILDLRGHGPEDVVPAELMLTAREALVFGMGCAVGRTAALVGEHAWQEVRREEWTVAERAEFRRRRDDARREEEAYREREAAEHEAARLRWVEEHRRRRAAGERPMIAPSDGRGRTGGAG